MTSILDKLQSFRWYSSMMGSLFFMGTGDHDDQIVGMSLGTDIIFIPGFNTSNSIEFVVDNCIHSAEMSESIASTDTDKSNLKARVVCRKLRDLFKHELFDFLAIGAIVDVIHIVDFSDLVDAYWNQEVNKVYIVKTNWISHRYMLRFSPEVFPDNTINTKENLAIESLQSLSNSPPPLIKQIKAIHPMQLIREEPKTYCHQDSIVNTLNDEDHQKAKEIYNGLDGKDLLQEKRLTLLFKSNLLKSGDYHRCPFKFPINGVYHQCEYKAEKFMFFFVHYEQHFFKKCPDFNFECPYCKLVRDTQERLDAHVNRCHQSLITPKKPRSDKLEPPILNKRKHCQVMQCPDTIKRVKLFQ
jgi:hypothetical protein